MILRKYISIFISTFFVFVFVAGLQSTMAQGTVIDVISQSEDHTIFSELLGETELDNVIAQPGPFTIIAPTDQAFEAMGPELDQIRENPQALQNVIIGHLFQGEVSSEDIMAALDVNIHDGDIAASNGLVHVTDEVMINQ